MKKDISKLLVNKLPNYSPNDRVWKYIDEELKLISEKTNHNIINDKLPQYNAPERIWNKIEIQLEANRKKKIQFYVLKVAAVFLLILGTAFITKYYISNGFSNYKIIYETAVISDSKNNMDLDFNFNIKDNSKLIAEQCKSYPKICNDENYIELNELYQKIIIEEERLSKQFEKFNDPEIKNYLIKTEREKAKIEKYMLEMFTK